MAGSNMTGDVKAALKDLQADIISLKHETQTCIMDASMRKALLTESEKDVREDIRHIRGKLEAMLKSIESKAIMALNAFVKTEREIINSEILSLEAEHKSIEDLELFIKSMTSNTSTKPLQEGREKCDVTKERLDRYRNSAAQNVVQFVLHPLLTCILEQIESFAMGEIVLRPKFDEDISENVDGVPLLISEHTNVSTDPSRTTFMRSNSSLKLRQGQKETQQTQSGGQSSQKEAENHQQSDKESKPNKNTNKGTEKGKSLSRQNTQIKQNSFSRQNSSDIGKSGPSKLNTGGNVKGGKGVTASTGSQSQTLRDLTRSSSNMTGNQPKGKPTPAADKHADEFRSIAGLKATITQRSASAPLINLVSPVKSAFAPIFEDFPAPVITYKDALETRKHDDNCYITGVTIMPNGNIVVCDNVHDSLQLYSSELHYISELECLHPWSVTPVSDSSVAVTLHYDHKVVLVKASDSLERLNEKDILLKCKSSLCFDIKFYEFRLYVLCINSDIHVIDLKGREYNVIRTGLTPNTIKYMDVNLDNQSVFVSGENGVACLDFRGLPLWHYKVRSKGRMFPTGVLVLKGRVIVCDWSNHCLHELYEDGAKIRTVFKENIEKPVAIAASVTGDMVLFSQGDYNMDADKSRIVRVLTVDNADARS